MKQGNESAPWETPWIDCKPYFCCDGDACLNSLLTLKRNKYPSAVIEYDERSAPEEVKKYLYICSDWFHLLSSSKSNLTLILILHTCLMSDDISHVQKLSEKNTALIMNLLMFNCRYVLWNFRSFYQSFFLPRSPVKQKKRPVCMLPG